MSKSFRICFYLLLSFVFLSGCDQAPETTQKTTSTVQLTPNNIQAHNEQMAKNYLRIQKQLTDAYHKATKTQDIQSFIQYRNSEWTNEYIRYKNQYAEVYELNKDFIDNRSAAQLFQLYEDLIYIGLNLKNGLLDKNSRQQSDAIKAAQQAELVANQFIKAAPVEKRPKSGDPGIMIVN